MQYTKKIRWAEENSAQELILLLKEQKALYEERSYADINQEFTQKYFD